jgi:ribonucleoside-diphosphate reductase beta chain
MSVVSVIKRNNDVVRFDADKIRSAVEKAMSRTTEEISSIYDDVVRYVTNNIQSDSVNVDEIHKLVENALMDSKAFDTAREYVTYRNNNKPNVFRPRIAYKPFEYPSVEKYVDAMQQSYWIVTEFNFQGDIQEFMAEMPYHEQQAVRRSMLAISQVEVSVKKFWSRIGDRLPKPEFEEVGTAFGESELRHSKAYAKLLELLGLNNEFDDVMEIPAIRKRVNVANKAIANAKTDSQKDFMESVLLFSLFIENVSLFSQFLVISQINKETGRLSGMSNVVGATSLEEQMHAKFGAELVNIMREENPDWFTDELAENLYKLVDESYEAEKAIIDWIFKDGDLGYLTRGEVVEYIKNRYNMGLEDAGFPRYFDVDEGLLTRVKWFDVQNMATSHTDFFAQRSINYTKFDSSFDEDELF